MSGTQTRSNSARRRVQFGLVIAGALILGALTTDWGFAQESGGSARSDAGSVHSAGAIPAGDISAHDRQLRELVEQTASVLRGFEPVSSGFLAPVTGVVSSSFGWRNISVAGNRFHGGIDIAVDRGTPVIASADGVVTHAGWAGAYGFAVYLAHSDGFETRYAHLDEVSVQVGTFVRQGDPLGVSGSSGAVTGPHLHFEIRVAGAAVDPFEFVDIRHRPR